MTPRSTGCTRRNASGSRALGGRVRRVILDYELKAKVYAPLAKARRLPPERYARRAAGSRARKRPQGGRAERFRFPICASSTRHETVNSGACRSRTGDLPLPRARARRPRPRPASSSTRRTVRRRVCPACLRSATSPSRFSPYERVRSHRGDTESAASHGSDTRRAKPISLRLAALHSGYFLRRQVAQFLGSRDGSRVTQLVQKALAHRARAQFDLAQEHAALSPLLTAVVRGAR